MIRRRRAAIAAALAVTAVAAVTAGCGGGSTSSALQLDPVAAAATKTQDAGAARIRFAMAITGPKLQGKTIHMRGTGLVDGTSAEMSFKLASMLHSMGAASRIPPATLAKLKHESIKEIVLEQNGDYVIYMRIPFLSSQLPGGQTWMKLDLSTLGKSAGVDLGKLLSNGSQLEPSDLLSMLKSEGAKVTNLGSATVGGTATTHYRVRINLAKALQAKGLTSPLLSSMAAQMKTSPSEDVWIDKNGLVRRLKLAESVAHRARVGMTLDFSDYGAHVSITAPPSSQVFDATQLAQQGLAAANH
jgi:hypothetical protein